MIKGNTRQVIIVRGADSRLFEQAVFFLREDGDSISEEALLDEAMRAADRYTLHKSRRCKPLPHAIWLLIGAVSVGVLWALSLLL